MAKLKTEYTDVKDVKHQVQHTTVADEGRKNKEQILEELFTALTKKDRRSA